MQVIDIFDERFFVPFRFQAKPCQGCVASPDSCKPKAAAAQVSIDRGEGSPFIIKEIEDSAGGRNPDQAAPRVLAPSRQA